LPDYALSGSPERRIFSNGRVDQGDGTSEMGAHTDNIDPQTVAGFGEEWAAYDQSGLDAEERARLFEEYFSVFPFDSLPAGAEGFDMGCGSGRWAALAAPRVGTLHCIDPAGAALAVARRNLAGLANCRFHLAGVSDIPLPDASQDFGYSLGVLHHIPDTEAAMRSCIAKLKPGSPFLVYLYYALDNRPAWFRGLWKASDFGRRLISGLPFRLRKPVTVGIAYTIYWPLSRLARGLERRGMNVASLPLSAYRHCSLYTLKTDALDRFGTRLEQRFSRTQIETMMRNCGLTEIRFRQGTPYWVACGRKVAA
jgi:SAM-dependent methyltransferase